MAGFGYAGGQIMKNNIPSRTISWSARCWCLAVLWAAAASIVGSAADAALARWCGHWRGTLEIWGTDQVVKSIPMELLVSETAQSGQYTWTIVYDQGEKRQERAYRLLTEDAATGRYAVDERNGIVIPMRRFGMELVSQFSVQGNRILSRYSCGTEGTMLFELYSFQEKGARVSGGTQDVPAVTGEWANGFQRAVLRRASRESSKDAPAARP